MASSGFWNWAEAGRALARPITAAAARSILDIEGFSQKDGKGWTEAP
jgi:hypothetical protein